MNQYIRCSRCLLFSVSVVILFLALPSSGSAATMEERRRQAIQQVAKTIARSRDALERREAAKAMEHYPIPESIPPLIEALADQDQRVRIAAASSLWSLSDQAKANAAAEAALRKALDDTIPGVQIRASWALQNMGVSSSELIPTWRNVLQNSTKDYDQFWAAYGLIGTEPPITLIQPVLDYAQRDADSAMGERALLKLAATGDRTLIEPMRKALTIFHPGNTLILKALRTYDPKPDQWLELVLSQIEFKNDRLTLNALGIIRNQPRKEEEVLIWLPKVSPLIEGNNKGIRSMSMALLGMAGGHAADRIPALLYIMDTDPDASIRRDAAGVIGEIGDRSASFSSDLKETVALEAQPGLCRTIEYDRDRGPRVGAIRSLGKLQIDPVSIQPLLVRVVLNSDDLNVQSAALQTLGLSGSASEETIRQLSDFQATANPRIARQVERILKSMSVGRTASPTLSTTAKDNPTQNQAMANLRSMDASFDEMAFFRALTRADEAKIKGYLDAGISPNYRFTSMNNQSALYALVNSMRACNAKIRPTPEKTKDLVRLFLEKGCDPNLTDNMGNTALMGAASKCDAELIQILLDAGADPNVQSKAGLTAIEFSFMFANDGANALIDAGARLSADKSESYKAAYGANPAALELIERASAR